MRLQLSLVAWPDGAKPEMREIDGELAIGRGQESGWVLSDPTRPPRLSRLHCMLSPSGDTWQITDHSLNGTFLNDDPAPLGREQTHDLHDGDRIRLGDYVIEARYQAPAGLRTPAGGPNAARDPFAGEPNPFGDAADKGSGSGWGPGGWSVPAAPAADPAWEEHSPAWPPPAWPPTPSAAEHSGSGAAPDPYAAMEAFINRPVADHTPAISDNWQAPPSGRVVLPDDWDLEPSAPARRASPPQAPAAAPGGLLPEDWDAEIAPAAHPPTANPAAPAWSAPPEPAAAPAPAAYAPPPAAPNQGWSPSGAASEAAPFGQPSAAPVAYAPPGAVNPARPPAAETSPFGQPPPPAYPPPGAPAPQPSPGSPPPAAPDPAADAVLLGAFLRGLGLPSLGTAPPAATLEAAGRLLRTLVEQLRAEQISRHTIKREFRILATMVRSEDNNPLKFSPTTEAGLAALLAGRRPPERYLAEVLDDIRLHELAMVAAMRDAVRALLEQLNPARLQPPEERGLAAIVPMHRKARAFEAYEALYARTLQALDDDFDSVFGKAFALAYERVALNDAPGNDAPGPVTPPNNPPGRRQR